MDGPRQGRGQSNGAIYHTQKGHASHFMGRSRFLRRAGERAALGLAVSEMFASIQGESTFQGLPMGFVRLAGCNLACKWCDTAYAREGGVFMSLDAIVSAVRDWNLARVEITGGEPLLQAGTPALAKRLLDLGYTVLVETNGSLDISVLPRECVRIVDVKCPGSGEAKKNDPGNLARLTPNDELKFVISDRGDYEFARNFLSGPGQKAGKRVRAVHFSPVAETLNPADLASWILEERLDVRLTLQIHKILWGDKQGV